MNVRWYTRLLLIGLMTLLAVAPTFAAKPQFQTIEVNMPPTEIAQCAGFSVLVEEQGRMKISTHVDKNGNVVKEIVRYHIATTLTNSVTGQSVSGPNAGIDKVTFNADGSITVASSGRGVISVDGEDFSYFQGTLVFTITPNGDTTIVSRSGNFQDLCSVLD